MGGDKFDFDEIKLSGSIETDEPDSCHENESYKFNNLPENVAQKCHLR